MATTTNYTWNPLTDSVLAETDAAGNVLCTYTNEPSQFGPLISENRGGVTSFYHADAIGSTRLTTNSSQEVVDEFLFDAWGNTVTSTAPTATPYQWCGRWGYQYDAVLATAYVRLRSFQAIVGRWTSFDPLDLVKRPLIVKGYLYSSNAPINLFDPSGLQPPDISFPDEYEPILPEFEEEFPFTNIDFTFTKFVNKLNKVPPLAIKFLAPGINPPVPLPPPGNFAPIFQDIQLNFRLFLDQLKEPPKLQLNAAPNRPQIVPLLRIDLVEPITDKMRLALQRELPGGPWGRFTPPPFYISGCLIQGAEFLDEGITIGGTLFPWLVLTGPSLEWDDLSGFSVIPFSIGVKP